MADNYTYKDAGGNTLTHASKELSAGVHASKHVEVDDAGVAIAKAEDAAHSSGDKGVMALAVRKDSAAALASDGDYIPLTTDANGYLHVADGPAATLLGGVTESAPGTDTASSGLNGRLQRIAQRLTSLIALLPASLGQKTMANSLAVAFASDQTSIPTTVLKASSVLATAVSVGTSATALPAAPLSNRRALKIYNASTVTVYIGGSGVTTGSGYPLEPGQGEAFEIGDCVIYGRVASATAELRVLEIA